MILRIPSLALGASLLLYSSLPHSVLAVSPSDVPADLPVNQILTLAQSALSSGAAQDALAYYDIAVSRDPQNYLTLFKRGATQLSLGRSSQALSDFDKVLTIKPGFEGALAQRAKIRARRADWDAARQDYITAGREKNAEQLQELEQAEGAAKLAKDASKKKDWDACIAQSSVALAVAGMALDIRKLRSRCRLEKGEVMEAVADLRHLVQLNPSATEPAMQISAMTFYSLGEGDKGVEAVRKCLHSDPDSKPCGRLFKREKKVDKALKKVKQLLEKRSFSSAVKLLVSTPDESGLIDQVKEDVKEYRAEGLIHPKAPGELLGQLLDLTCDAYLQMNNHKRASPYCTDLLAHRPEALSGLLHKAQALIDASDYEAAIRTLNTAGESHQDEQHRIDPLLQKAHKLLKQSKTKDYYAVLGLSRDASKKDIKRAYLRLSKEHHPDKATSPDARPAAEKKMAAINEAYEVLKDPELKQRYDNGDDPNDPEAQARGAGGPFQGSPFGPFGGGGGGGQQFFFRSGPGGFGGGMPNFGGPGGGFKFQAGGGGGFPF